MQIKKWADVIVAMIVCVITYQACVWTPAVIVRKDSQPVRPLQLWGRRLLEPVRTRTTLEHQLFILVVSASLISDWIFQQKLGVFAGVCRKWWDLSWDLWFKSVWWGRKAGLFFEFQLIISSSDGCRFPTRLCVLSINMFVLFFIFHHLRASNQQFDKEKPLLV